MIQSTNTLNDHQLLEAKALIAICQKYDGTFRDPYLSNMLNFDPDMPAFFLYYEKGELVGLLTVYADDQDVEVAILVHPNHKSIFFQPFRQGHGMTAAAQGAVYIYTMRIGEHRINHLMKKYGGMMEFHETLPL